MTEETRSGSACCEERKGHMPACCREMMEKMGDCGAMMARFKEMMKPGAASSDEAKPEHG